MHELGIVFHIIKTLERVACENDVMHIRSVTLELGEVSGIESDYLLDCWKWATERTELLNGASLICETIPAVTVCNDCHKTYATVEHGRTCPFCSSENTVLVTGNETSIKEMEADTP